MRYIERSVTLRYTAPKYHSEGINAGDSYACISICRMVQNRR